MGSFDAVCGLSNMAIGDGDPVVAMVIRKNPWCSYSLSPIYPFDVWQPASMLVRGQYGDYGDVTLDNEAQSVWRLTQNRAKEWYERVWIEPHTDTLGKEWPGRWGMQNTTLDYTFDETGKRADIRHSREDGPEKVFTLWMAHAGIFDDLMRTVQIEWFNNGAKGFSDKTVREVADHQLGNARRLTNGEITPDFAKLASDLGDDTKRIARVMRSMRNPWKAGTATDHNPVTDYFEEAIWDAHDDGDTEQYEMLCRYWHSFHALNLMLYQLRKSVAPPGTIGPQHGHDQPFVAMGAAITEQVRRNKQKYFELNGEDEADDGETA